MLLILIFLLFLNDSKNFNDKIKIGGFSLGKSSIKSIS